MTTTTTTTIGIYLRRSFYRQKRHALLRRRQATASLDRDGPLAGRHDRLFKTPRHFGFFIAVAFFDIVVVVLGFILRVVTVRFCRHGMQGLDQIVHLRVGNQGPTTNSAAAAAAALLQSSTRQDGRKGQDGFVQDYASIVISLCRFGRGDSGVDTTKGSRRRSAVHGAIGLGLVQSLGSVRRRHGNDDDDDNGEG